jgi:hypothetical protein
MNLKKVIGWIIVILLVFMVIEQPTQAAHSLRDLGNTLDGWATSVTIFFTHLV